MRIRTSLLVVLALAVAPSAAYAAPSNDAQSGAASLDPLPASVNGTTVGATTEGGEPFSRCGTIGPSVWYSTVAADDGRIVVTALAHGDLDLIVDVEHKVRSQLTSVSCDASDDNGAAATEFQAEKGATYLVRVSERGASVSGTFALAVSAPKPPDQPPGPALPPGGVTRSLERITNPADDWSVDFHVGVSYRIRLSGRGGGDCHTSAELFGPRPTSFSGDPVVSLDCDSYRLFTPGPGQGGRYSLRVIANAQIRSAQAYHLQVAPAQRDDATPGLILRDRHQVHGALNGNAVDLVDLYRFQVTRRSVTYLRLSGGDFELELLNDHGIVLRTSRSAIRLRTSPGRYYVAVRVSQDASVGHYTLTRATRFITRTHVHLSGGVGLLTAKVVTAPHAAGQFEITFERFDPLAGWLFSRRVRVRGNGTVSATYRPLGPGRYRAQAIYLGSERAAGSHSGFSYRDIPG